jgi:hypothetical protein
MYFNTKFQHVGNVFIKPFRSKHIDSDAYLRQILPYVHLNPAEIFEPKFRDGIVLNAKSLEKKLLDYPYASLVDYESEARPETNILDQQLVSDLRGSHWFPIQETLASAIAYYGELS